MPRERSPERDKAYELWKSSKGEMKLKDIAEQLGVSDILIRKWKNQDKWDDQLKGKVTKTKSNVTNKQTKSNGNVKGNGNAKGNAEGGGISWAEIESEYVTDIRKKPITLEELAKKHGISYSYIMEYAAEHKWTDKRRNNLETTKEIAAEKSVKILSDDISRATARHLRISDKLLKVVEEALEDANEFYKVVEKLKTGYGPGEFDEKIVVETVGALNDAKLKNVVDSFERLQKAQRQALAILDEKDRRKIELDEKKANGEGEADETLIEDWVSAIVDEEQT